MGETKTFTIDGVEYEMPVDELAKWKNPIGKPVPEPDDDSTPTEIPKP